MPENRIYYGQKEKLLKCMSLEYGKRSVRVRRGDGDGGGLSFS